VVEEHFHTRPISHDNSNQRIRCGMKNARRRKQSRKSAEIKSVRRIGNRGVVGVTIPLPIAAMLQRRHRGQRCVSSAPNR